MAKSATNKKTEETTGAAEKTATGKKTKSNVSEFPKKTEDLSKVSALLQKDIGSRVNIQPPPDVSENAHKIFHIIREQLTVVSFDEISDKTNFSFDEINKAIKELEAEKVINRLPELQFELSPNAVKDAPPEESADNAANLSENAAQGGNPAEGGVDPQEDEPEEDGESYDMTAGVDGTKLKEAVAKVEAQANDAEAEKKIIKLPRNQRLPEMQEEGAIPELEDKALTHENCTHTIKIMKQKQETLRAEMLNLMKKANLENYKHGGFVIKRETKGETVKVVSVQNKEDE